MISGISLVDSFCISIIWQSTLFLLVGLILSFVLRNHAARAHRILLLSIIASVLVPAMTIFIRHLGLGFFEAKPLEIQSQAEEPLPDKSFGPYIFAPTELSLQPQTGVENKLLVESTKESAEVPFSLSTFIRLHWRIILLFGWAAISFLMIVRLIVTFSLGVRLLRKAEPLECDRINNALHHVKTKLGIQKDVRLFASRRIKSPVIWCWKRKPVLLVPKDAGRFHERIDWTGILCHELAHWKRRDHIDGLIAEIALCIIPWQVLLWWAKIRMINLSEHACDDWVIATGKTGADYAESLLDLTPGGQMAFVPSVVRNKNELAQRIRRILKDSCGNPRTGLLWAVAACLITCSFAVTVAFAQTRPAGIESVNETDVNENKVFSEQSLKESSIKQISRSDQQIFQLKYIMANRAAEIIHNILVEPGINDSSKETTIIPVPEKKWLIVRTETPEDMELIKELIEILDAPENAPGTDQSSNLLKTFKLRYADPSKLVDLLKSIFKDSPDFEISFMATQNDKAVFIKANKYTLDKIEKLIQILDVSDTPTNEPMVHINLSNADINEIIKTLIEWTGKAVVPSHEAMNLRITVFSPEKMARSEALKLLYAVMKENGFVAEETGDIVYIKPIPLLDSNESLEKVQNKDPIILKVFKLNYFSASAMGQIILPFLDSYGYVSANESNNTLIVMDTTKTIMRIEQIIKQYDIPYKNTLTKIFQFKYSFADKIAETVYKILQLEISPLSSEITLVPDMTTNSLIVRSSPENMKLIEDLLAILDEPAKTGSINKITTTSTLKGLSDTDSEKLAKLLKIVFDNKIDVKTTSENSGKTFSITSSLSDSSKIGKLIEWYLDAAKSKNQNISVPENDSDYIGPPQNEFIIDTSKNSQPAEYDAITVKYIDVDEIAKTLIKIIGQMIPDAERNISIQPLAQSRQLLVFGKKQYRDLVKKLLQEIDIPSNQLITKIYKLQYAKPEEVKSKLDVLFNNVATPADQGSRTLSAVKIVIVTYQSLKQIIVSASEENMRKIEKLITEWDSPVFSNPQ